MVRNLLVLPALCAGIIFGAAVSPCALTAQAPVQASSQQVPGVSEVRSVRAVPVRPVTSQLTSGVALKAGPTIAPVAFHTSSAESDFVVAAPDGPHGGLGSNLALVAVGAVGTFAGIKIGGGTGGAIAIAGAAVALYGLYHFLQ